MVSNIKEIEEIASNVASQIKDIDKDMLYTLIAALAADKTVPIDPEMVDRMEEEMESLLEFNKTIGTSVNVRGGFGDNKYIDIFIPTEMYEKLEKYRDDNNYLKLDDINTDYGRLFVFLLLEYDMYVSKMV